MSLPSRYRRGAADPAGHTARSRPRWPRRGALRAWIAGLALAGSLIVAPITHAEGVASSWLDQPAGSDNWNYSGMPIPTAVTYTGYDTPPNCGQDVRWAETYEDDLLQQNGWLLLASYQAGWGVKVVYGQSGFDGMCRPIGYQGFVFVDGVFAGTVSPVPMDSRSDGAETDRHLYARDNLVVEYNRYTETDALCCPSGSATVFFQIHETPDGPVVRPAQITNSQNQTG